MMKLGIVGLPNVGKSTLFNAITGSAVDAANYPFCTIDPNVGTVSVPDTRLDFLNELYKPKRLIPAAIEFVDIAGLVKGASKGEGLGNQFLSHIRQTHALVHVVRCFDDSDIIHVEGTSDPERDIGILELELALSDIEIIGRQIERAKKNAKGGGKAYLREAEILQDLQNHLNSGGLVRTFVQPPDVASSISQLDLLSAKPVIYAANLDEASFSEGFAENPYYRQVQTISAKAGALTLPISAKVEEEIIQLSPEYQAVFLEELGLTQSGLDRLIQCSYDLLGLISFFTVVGEEVRAWTIARGTSAYAAAGKIHSDFQRGFIRAEVIPFDELKAIGDMAKAKAKGQVRSEGKDYEVQDGDVIQFRFNV